MADTKTRINWRGIEQPTFRLRMRAFYNTLKAKLLGKSHDPVLPQFDEFLQALTSHEKNNLGDRQPDRRTIEAWRAGASPLVERHQALVKAICPQALQWLDSTPVAGPLARHLYVVDALALELVRTRDVLREKERRADKAIDAVDLVWSCFTRPKLQSLPELSILRIDRQLLVLRGAGCSAADLHTAAKLGAFALPDAARAKFVPRDKWSLFPFLIAVVAYCELDNDDFRGLVAVDLATVAAAIRTRNYCGKVPFAFSGKDHFGIQSIAVLRLLWEDDSDATRSWWELLLSQENPQDPGSFTRFLGVRENYYRQFLRIGVTPDELQELTRLWMSPPSEGPDLLFAMRNGKLLKLPL